MLDLQQTFTAESIGLRCHDHPCLIYEDLAELAAACVPYLQAGLLLGEHCIYFINENPEGWIREAMRANDFDLQPHRDRGAFQIIHTRDAHLSEGHFEEQKMVSYWHASLNAARDAGFKGMRAAVEMTWAVSGHPGCDVLVPYESRLNRFTDANAVSVICAYRRQRFSPGLLKGVIHAHPIVIAGNEIMPNPNFVKPDVFVEGDDSLALAFLQRAGGLASPASHPIGNNPATKR